MPYQDRDVMFASKSGLKKLVLKEHTLKEKYSQFKNQ